MNTSNVFFLGLSVAACFLVTGCMVMFPVSHSRTPATSHHDPKDFEFIKVGRTDHTTVTNRLGKFDGYYGDLRIGYYELNHVSAKMLWLVFPGIPVDRREMSGGLDVTMIQFDDRDRVRRFDTFMEWNPEDKLRSRAEALARPKPSASPKSR